MGGRGTPAHPYGQQMKINQYIKEQSENAEIERIKTIRDQNGMIGIGAGGTSGNYGLKRCACCDNFSIPIGSKYETCSICGWVDDEYQNMHPKSSNGKNTVSLEESRKKYHQMSQNDTTRQVK